MTHLPVCLSVFTRAYDAYTICGHIDDLWLFACSKHGQIWRNLLSFFGQLSWADPTRIVCKKSSRAGSNRFFSKIELSRLNSSSWKRWSILQLNRSESETTNALQCQVPVWGDHKKSPRTAKNGDNYWMALKRNMGSSAHGNLVQWVNLQNRRRGGPSWSHYMM